MIITSKAHPSIQILINNKCNVCMAQKWFVMCLLCACATVSYAMISSLNIWDNDDNSDDAAADDDDDDYNDDITSDI